MLHQEMLIMAMTRRQSGICTAGFINQTHPESGLCWVRPVKEYKALRLGDMTDGTGQICRLGDVVRLKLLEPRPEPPHPEDWLTDFIRQRPVIDRQLTGYRRSEFLQKYVDNNPAAVLNHHERSLCLVRPKEVWATFFLDNYSGKYEARMGFHLAGHSHASANSERGLPVTDLKWQTLGRQWCQQSQQEQNREYLMFDHDQL